MQTKSCHPSLPAAEPSCDPSASYGSQVNAANVEWSWELIRKQRDLIEGEMGGPGAEGADEGSVQDILEFRLTHTLPKDLVLHPFCSPSPFLLSQRHNGG